MSALAGNALFCCLKNLQRMEENGMTEKKDKISILRERVRTQGRSIRSPLNRTAAAG